MPLVQRREHRVHFTVDGDGPPVVMLHGLLLDGGSFDVLATALSARFIVVRVDTLGHGHSSKPTDEFAYRQAEQAADVVAVLDELDLERAHVLGHSMGGWLAVGLAKYAPARLASLTIAGWDIEAGMPASPAGPVTFDMFMGFARQTAPQIAAQVTRSTEPALRRAFEALTELDDAADAVAQFEGPVLLWAGEQDPYVVPMRSFADRHGLPFLASPGDHLGAVLSPTTAAVERLARHLEA